MELVFRMNTEEERRNLIELYADSESAFIGENEDGERMLLSISESGIVATTYQNNGWTRINYYDANGDAEGETYDGRWR